MAVGFECDRCGTLSKGKSRIQLTVSGEHVELCSTACLVAAAAAEEERDRENDRLWAQVVAAHQSGS